jgi:CRP-like cAMP-binding protein
MERQRIRLLEVEPQLAAGLPRHEVAEARARIIVTEVRLGQGEWTDGELDRTLGVGGGFGYVLTDGLIGHELALNGRAATQLLGPGDVVASAALPSRLLPVLRVFTVTEDVCLAVLDGSFVGMARRWPTVAGALLVRAEQQAERVAVHQLISQLPRADERIVALMWHLADQWGYEEEVGTVVPLTLGHEAIGRLVGGRRATISGALSRLAEQGYVGRLANGTWLVTPASRGLLTADRPPRRTPAIIALGARRGRRRRTAPASQPSAS